MTQMFCDGVNPQGFGGYNSHPGGDQYQVTVPFIEAIHNPPRCKRHDRPYLTLGGLRLSRVMGRFRESGELTATCRIDHGFAQATWCHNHDAAGSASEFRNDRCPNALIAAWIIRRHQVGEA